MKIGYARVSTKDQNLELQIDALKKAGCTKIYKEKVSGVAKKLPELEKCLNDIREKDILIVWKLDRLGRSLPHLVNIVTDLEERGAKFKCLTSPMDTTSAQGKLVFGIFASLSQFERELIKERTLAGQQLARKNGKTFGRPRKISESDMKMAISLINSGEYTRAEVAEKLNIDRATLWRRLKNKAIDTTPSKKVKKKKEELEVKIFNAKLHLQIQRNNKYVRGMKKTRQHIEDYILSEYDYKKLDKEGTEYQLKIPYENEKELEEAINEMRCDIHSEAESNHCFIEDDDIQDLDNSDRWL